MYSNGMRHQQNRQRLSKVTDGGLVVCAGNITMQQSGDMSAPFLQESNFLWLTGINLPGWKAIIRGSNVHTTLVRPTRSEIEVVFDGGVSDEDALKISGADKVIKEKDLESELRQIARNHSLVCTVKSPNYHFMLNPAEQELNGMLGRIFQNVTNCRDQLAKLRAIKSPEEIAAIEKAVDVTCKAFTQVRANLEEYTYEYQIEADMTRAFRYVNSHHAYEPIIASGGNAVTLHYTDNSKRLSKRGMVLIDVGARVGGYAADITRTYCLNPSKRQRRIHEVVQTAQQSIIALLQPGLMVGEYIHQVDEIMKDALQELGLLNDRADETTYRHYFPHAISHGLGLDVHDSLGAPKYFEPGMVLTVEPGIYIPEESIGVRIEDDILITEKGHRNLSRKLPITW